MNITLIAAMAHNRAIGYKNTLPWYLPADFAHFKKQTMGKPIMMGRKTYESIGKALPGRINIVISREKDLQIDGCEVVNSLDAGLAIAEKFEEVMVIGGESFYQQMIDKADKLVLTLIDMEVANADAFFPEFKNLQWQEIDRKEHKADIDNPYNYSFVSYQKITK